MSIAVKPFTVQASTLENIVVTEEPACNQPDPGGLLTLACPILLLLPPLLMLLRRFGSFLSSFVTLPASQRSGRPTQIPLPASLRLFIVRAMWQPDVST